MGAMHTTATGRAQLGEEVGDAHDAVCGLEFKGPGGLPVEDREGDGVQRREWQARQAGDGQLGRRAASCNGLSRGGGSWC